MPWARFDDRFPSNRKVRPLSDAAFRLYVSSVCWSAENLTDGVVETKELSLVSDVKAAKRRAQELVERGLWNERPEGGWAIHDYHDYNPTAAQVRIDRAAKTARQQRWRNKNKGDDTPPEPPADDDDVDASTDASRNASRDGSRDASPRARVPVPPRPDPNLHMADVEGDPPGSRDRGTERPDSRPSSAPIDDDGFVLTDAMRRWAVQTFGTTLDADHETAQFVSHHRAEATRRKSWPDEWQKWMRRSAKWASERGTQPATQGAFLVPLPGGGAAAHTPSRPSTTDQRVRDGLALAARLRALDAERETS